MKGPRRKIVIRALIFLLLGAVMNVAAAWGLSLLIDPFSIQPPARMYPEAIRAGGRLVGDRFWFAQVQSRMGATRLSAGMRSADAGDDEGGPDPRDILPRWWKAGWYRDLKDPPPPWVRAEARGWPMLSMWHEVQYRDHATGRGRMKSVGGIELPLPYWLDPTPFSNYDQPRTLPLRFIWPHFAINTIFYAAVLWILWTAPAALRRQRRLRRGLCPACAYPIGTSEVCTECGAAITPSALRPV